jgi:integrase
MGRRDQMKLPPYVHGYLDRHGKARWYFRKAGFKTVALPGLPWSPEFMAAHEMAAGGQPLEIGTARVKSGTMRALATSYFDSAGPIANSECMGFRSMKHSTQSVYRNIIERFCEERGKNGIKYGDMSATSIERQHIIKLLAERAEKPDSANGLRKALRAMMAHAVAIGLRKDDPTQGVKAIKSKSKTGFHRWSEEEIARFEARFPIGTKPRLALALGLFTGQARQDVIAMGRQHISRGRLRWTRKKTENTTGLELEFPVHSDLIAILDVTPSGHLTFLVTELGKPFSAAGFGNWFREQCDSAGLRHCTFHGLRKAAAVRLAEAGCTPHEIAAITGHASLKEIVRYTATVDRKRLAESAMAKVKSRTSAG